MFMMKNVSGISSPLKGATVVAYIGYDTELKNVKLSEIYLISSPEIELYKSIKTNLLLRLHPVTLTSLANTFNSVLLYI